MPTTPSGVPAVPEGTSKPAHPDAQYQGKVASLTSEKYEVMCGRSDDKMRLPRGLELTIRVDQRDPSGWGPCPIMLWCLPMIELTQFESLAHLNAYFSRLAGPFRDFVQAAIDEINPNRRRDYEGVKVNFVDERVRAAIAEIVQS